VFFDSDISAYIAVTLEDWGGRWYYFTGRYYDLANRLLIKKFLRKGDTYIDIGANLGMHTIAASRAVGVGGRVVAIEPNPEAMTHLRSQLVINGISNVTLVNAGLSDKAGQLILSGADDHTGTFTLRPIPKSLHAIEVPVFKGDDVLGKMQLPGRTLVKIDTEGHEHHVVRGLKGLMSHGDVGFVVEVTDQWLRQTGSSAAQLYDEFRKFGFSAFGVEIGYNFFRPTLRLTAIDVPPEGQHDVFFTRGQFLL
jgi:FkbM family methyltransferase